MAMASGVWSATPGGDIASGEHCKSVNQDNYRPWNLSKASCGCKIRYRKALV